MRTPLFVFAYRRRESPCAVAARLALIALWNTPFMSAQGCFLGGIPAVMSLSPAAFQVLAVPCRAVTCDIDPRVW